jgi:hypothetical protein
MRSDQVSILLSGYDEQLHRPLCGVRRDIDVLFVGGLTPRRKKILDRIAAHAPITVHRAFGEDMVRLFNRSRIVLNLHAANHLDTETRVFEALGCGAFLLSERLSEESPFRAGEHYAQVDDHSDFEKALAYWLSAPEHAASIAAAGHEEAARNHTYRNRARSLTATFESHIAEVQPNSAPLDLDAVRAFARRERLHTLCSLAGRVRQRLGHDVRRGRGSTEK